METAVLFISDSYTTQQNSCVPSCSGVIHKTTRPLSLKLPEKLHPASPHYVC